MNQLTIILILGLSLFSCANGMTDTNVKTNQDQRIHKTHNANIMRQINNDMVINKGINLPNTNTIYKLDKIEMSQIAFLKTSLDSIFYLQKILHYTNDQIRKEQLQVSYTGYTEHHYTKHKFVPQEFDLSFDESDQLVLTVSHPMNGELYAYGFDRSTGKQGIRAYHKLDFEGSFSGRQHLLSRNIEELRFVMTIADSIYIHDFKIEDFYSHDH